jgi:hypothetical protein
MAGKKKKPGDIKTPEDVEEATQRARHQPA